MKMSVKIIRLWPIPVLIFCIYCLYTLVADSYEVLYLKRNETDPLQFLACLELSRVWPNKTEIELKQLKDDLYNHLNSSDGLFGFRKVRPERFEKLILNRTKSGSYLVLNRRVCLVVEDRKELDYIDLFLSSGVYRPVFFAMKIETFDFLQMNNLWDSIHQLIVRKKEHPSDCNQSNSERFFCLNECFRRHFRLSRYFYQANETGSILLHFNESNQKIQESERICFAQCKRENCKLIQLILINRYKEAKIFEAELVLSAFDFWVEIVGLIFSFVGLFFDKSASTVTKLVDSRVNQRKVKVGLFYLNLAIIILSLAFCGYLCARVAFDQQTEADDLQREMTRNLIHPKTVHLVICMNIETKDYEGKTMWEIERATDRMFDDALEGIHVSDGGRSFRTDYQVHHSKILFKMLASRFLGRCFPLSIQTNHQTISSNPMLIVKLKKKVEFYVLSRKENLSRNSVEYRGRFAFQERIVKRLNGKCVDYKAKYGDCTGRGNCLERCIGKKFIEKYNKTTFGVSGYLPYPVIDRDWFSPSEWNTSELIDIPNDNQSLYLNIKWECEEVVREKECDETKFERTVETGQPDDLIREIDLQFDVVQSVEELPYSLRMALDLLGIQSIFFGFTLLQLFWMVYQFTKPRWRLKNKTDNVVWFIVCLLASIGCSWTTVRMLDGIVNGKLVSIEHYEPAEQIQMPATVFCLRIDQKLVDRNHQLTGRYLEELTGNIITESTINSISYLNESNEWIPFDLHRVERFFLLNMKCFRVNIEEKYNRNQFHFSGDTLVMRVNFNRTKENLFVHFMTKLNETAEFSKILHLDYSGFHRYVITHEPSLYEHEDRFGFFRRHFPPLQEGDVGDLRGQLLELQINELNRRTLSLPVEEEHFTLEVDEDHFEQLHSLQRQKSPNKRTNLNYRQTFVTNHLRENRGFEFDFSFQLVFLRRTMHFTNEVNYATLTLALLNLLSLWLELGVLDLRPFLVHLHDHFLIYLYLHLPVLILRRLIKTLLLFYRWLKRLEPHLYERIDPPPVQPAQPALPLARAGRAQSAPVSRPPPRSPPPPPRLLVSARSPFPQAHHDPAVLLQVPGKIRTTPLRPDGHSAEEEEGDKESSPDDSSASDQSSVPPVT